MPNQIEFDPVSLERFERPVLRFMGEGSSEHAREVVIRLAESFPHSCLEERPGAHAPPVVSMERFLDILREFSSNANREGDGS